MKTDNSKTRILIADDHKMVRAGLAALLETEPDLQVVGQAENGKDAIAKALELAPDVVIMDLMMPVMDGVAATAELHRLRPEVKILILTTYGSSDGIAHALENGASGAIMKSADSNDLASAVRNVARGERSVSEEIQRQIAIDPPVPELTPRQLDILDSLVQGLSNPDIAKKFGIRRDSVKEHVNNILDKIGAANRTEAVAIALRKHLLKI